MGLPRQFKVIYEGDCGEQFELENCFVDQISLYCDECKIKHYFYSEFIIHTSWEWDTLELIEAADASV